MASTKPAKATRTRRRPTRACVVAFGCLAVYLLSAFCVIIVEVPGTRNAYGHSTQV